MPADFQVPGVGERALRAAGHALLAAGGVWGAFVALPKSLLLATNPVLLVVWAVFMLSGFAAAFAALKGKYLHEFALLPFMAAGVLIYVAAMAHVIIVVGNLGSGVGLFVVSAQACYIAARWVSLSQLLRSPLRLLPWRKSKGAE